MTEEALKFISDELEKAGIPYDFMEWTGEPPDTYFVGEYIETPPTTEDGLQEATFILTGTSRGDVLELERAKNRIYELFPPIGGQTVILANGTGLAVFYSDSMPVPMDSEEFKRIQTNLTIKEWRVK